MTESVCTKKSLVEWYEPEDPEGMRLKKYMFAAREEAEEGRKELALAWKEDPKKTSITKLEFNNE